MGARGPQPGTRYITRRTTIRSFRVSSVQEVSRAQILSDRLDTVLRALEADREYPVSAFDLETIRQVRISLELLQGAIIAGIAAFYDHEGN